MDKQTIINYCVNSPENTNPAVLNTLLDQFSQGGGEEIFPTIFDVEGKTEQEPGTFDYNFYAIMPDNITTDSLMELIESKKLVMINASMVADEETYHTNSFLFMKNNNLMTISNLTDTYSDLQINVEEPFARLDDEHLIFLGLKVMK